MASPSNERARPVETLAESFAALRAQAMESAPISLTVAEQTRGLVESLKADQVELQLQNDQLRRAVVEIKKSRARYFDYYDRAPVGYVTTDESGGILEINLRAATLLGISHVNEIRSTFSRFVSSEHKNIFWPGPQESG
jgi:PAS domain-containing protein